MKTSLKQVDTADIFDNLRTANLAFQQIYPGDSSKRQPVHTVYGGAHIFTKKTAANLGKVALNAFNAYASDFTILARALELPGHHNLPKNAEKSRDLQARLEKMTEEERKAHPAWLPFTVYTKVAKKLKKEAVEDFRIDFEDGFGNRSDKEEDETAVAAALQVAEGMKEDSLPPFIGIRIKPFTEELKNRSLRTLDIFLTTLTSETGGKLPANFIVMLPKVTIPDQITALVKLFEKLEHNLKLDRQSLKMEMMVETTQSIMDEQGKNPLLRFIRAGQGRLIATHFGTYDYTASCNITAKYQTMDHPVCDFAHHMTKVALAHTGIFLSDGATNVMPVGPHRGAELTDKQFKENQRVVHRAWKLGYEHVRHSLWNGFYQGWDLHPSQLVMRYAAVFTFFLESFSEAETRLSNFVEKAAQATLTTDVFDDAATGQGLLNFFLRALNSGAIDKEDLSGTGLTFEEIQSKSFLKILKNRGK